MRADEGVDAADDEVIEDQPAVVVGDDFGAQQIVARPRFVAGAGSHADPLALQVRPVLDVVVGVAHEDAEVFQAVCRAEVDLFLALDGWRQVVHDEVVLAGLEPFDEVLEQVGHELDPGHADALGHFLRHLDVVSRGLILVVQHAPGRAGLSVRDADHACGPRTREDVARLLLCPGGRGQHGSHRRSSDQLAEQSSVQGCSIHVAVQSCSSIQWASSCRAAPACHNPAPIVAQ
ncbi:hypothetical protein D9M72_442810 [compost metagenome]